MERRRNDSDALTHRPGVDLVGILRMPAQRSSPTRAVARRVLWALLAFVVVVLIVYIGRGGYRDVAGGSLSVLDCVYYATVSLTGTGYGDITAVTPGARLIDIVVITPLRILFLIVLIGTVLEVLSERSRQAFRIQRWRSKVSDHVVVVGFGTKGRSALDALVPEGEPDVPVVVVDTDAAALEAASARGLVTVHGSATRADILRIAGAAEARAIIVATGRDDTAVLVTLTARELAPHARIIASVREAENVHLLEQSGADSVVVSSETAGRLLGIAAGTPTVVSMVEDLLTPEKGLAIAEREVEPAEVGSSPRFLTDIVLGVVRAGQLYRVDAPEVESVEEGDRLLYVRRVTPADER